MSESANIERPSYADIVHKHMGKFSDKWSGYLPIYEMYFKLLRDEPISILEIGVQNGGSLECEAAYFSNAKYIVGCDINPDCQKLAFRESNVHLVVGDANSTHTKQEIVSICNSFDIIIDDGSHESRDIIQSFVLYFPHLNSGGFFIIEDLHCSYWQGFGGGLYDEHSSQSFLKLLADIVNFEHWGIGKTRREFIEEAFPGVLPEDADDWLASIFSVQFFNSVCVISKADPSQVSLGTRVIVGTDEAITKDAKQYDGTGPIYFAQEGSPFSRFHAWREELAASERECERLQTYVSGFRHQLIEKDREMVSRFKEFDKALESRDLFAADLCRRTVDILPPVPRGFEAILYRLRLKSLCRVLYPSGRASLLEDVKRIRKSGRFDPVYYLNTYPEALRDFANPIVHYLTIGWRSGCDPSAEFDGANYQRAHSTPIHQAPLLHALLAGKV